MPNTTKIEYFESVLEAIGNTPLIKLRKIVQSCQGSYFVKAEQINPGGSIKDRVGIHIIEDAEKEGRLHPGGTIVEATSGNIGVGLAIAAALKGYKCVFTIPDKMSQEKVRLLRAYGAEVIVTPTAVPHDSPESYTEVAKRIVRETPNSILANQFFNPKNPETHYRTTGPELWEQTGGRIDFLFCGIGTGGTISGAGKFLKEKNPQIKIIGIDPRGSNLKDFFINKKLTVQPKIYKLEGIGQDWIPGVLDFEVIDDIIEVTDKEAFMTARRMAREEGILTGGSSGAAIAGALKCKEMIREQHVAVIVLSDAGELYLSKIYNDDWMREHGFLIPDKITVRYVLQNKGKAIPNLVSIDPEASIRTALELFKEHNVSQMPVIERGKPVGTVLDSDLMSAVLEDNSRFEQPVRGIMGPSFPVIGIGASLQHAVDMMKKKDSAVLIQDEHKMIGILTRYDVLEYLSR